MPEEIEMTYAPEDVILDINFDDGTICDGVVKINAFLIESLTQVCKELEADERESDNMGSLQGLDEVTNKLLDLLEPYGYKFQTGPGTFRMKRDVVPLPQL